VQHFILWLKTQMDLPRPYEFEVARLVADMARVGLLYECGPEYSFIGMFGRAYWLTGSVRESQRSGYLYLSEALGPAFIIEQFGAVTAPITGTDEYGDPHTGSGLILDPTHILTNKHVVEDMIVDNEIPSPVTKPAVNWDNGHPPPGTVRVARTVTHPEADLAIIELEEDKPGLNMMSGIAFRDPTWADRAHVFGYPPVPMTDDLHLVHQSGEVVNPTVQTRDGQFFLYSSVTRPGNSGGPIVAQDGRVIGIVAHDVSIRPDEAPYYRGIPGGEVVRCVNEIEFGHLVRLEDWQL
jgi:S1-C subfamily serine protease